VISALPAVTTLVCFVSHLHARLRVHWAPGIPHALCFQGEGFMHDSGDQRRGNADPCLECPGCLKIEVAVREAISQTHSSCPDLIRASINLRKSFSKKMDHRVEPRDDGSLWCRGATPLERLHDSPVRRFA
jgi:hypothetical protein